MGPPFCTECAYTGQYWWQCYDGSWQTISAAAFAVDTTEPMLYEEAMWWKNS